MHSKQILDQNSQLIKAIIVSAAILFLLVINQAKYLFTVYISTGKHLSELYKFEYPKYMKYCLWLLAKVAVIDADIPEGKTIKLTSSFFFFLFFK